MEILIKRLYKKDTYTIGKMYIDGEYMCDTLEDKDRGLKDSDPLADIQMKKVYGETAIPTGVYSVEVTYSPKFKIDLPLVKNVKGFDGIRIHNGSFPKDSLGCILVGRNKIKGGLIESKITLETLMKKLEGADNILLTIV